MGLKFEIWFYNGEVEVAVVVWEDSYSTMIDRAVTADVHCSR